MFVEQAVLGQGLPLTTEAELGGRKIKPSACFNYVSFSSESERNVRIARLPQFLKQFVIISVI